MLGQNLRRGRIAQRAGDEIERAGRGSSHIHLV
jgi:hypothetical protein